MSKIFVNFNFLRLKRDAETLTDSLVNYSNLSLSKPHKHLVYFFWFHPPSVNSLFNSLFFPSLSFSRSPPSSNGHKASCDSYKYIPNTPLWRNLFGDLLGPCQLSTMEHFTKTVKETYMLNFFAKGFIIDAWKGHK